MLGPKLKDLFTQMTNNKKRLNSQKPTVMEETTREASWINSSQRWGYGLKLFSRIILSEHFDYKPNTEYDGNVGLGGRCLVWTDPLTRGETKRDSKLWKHSNVSYYKKQAKHVRPLTAKQMTLTASTCIPVNNVSEQTSTNIRNSDFFFLAHWVGQATQLLVKEIRGKSACK